MKMKEVRTTLLSLATLVMLTTLCGPELSAQTVRVAFFSGSVTVKSGSTTAKARLGQQVKGDQKIVVGQGATLQLSVNGKVLRYTTPATLSVPDVVKRAGSGENSVVANSVRTLAGASGAGRSSRTSMAGATRAEGEVETGYFDSLQTDAVNTGTMRINGELSDATGIEDALGLLTKTADRMKRESIVILQPRSTGITQDPILFRWVGSADITTYVVSLQDDKGDEVYRAETKDTAHIWDGAATLAKETIYTWRVADKDHPGNRWGATFHILSNAENTRVVEGRTALMTELGGAENPAHVLLLGSYYSDNDLYGQAAELFTTGALTQSEHAGTYRELACDQYLYNIFMPLEEAYRVCGEVE